METALLTAFAATLIMSVATASDVAVTVYNQNFAAVKESRTLQINAGIDTVALADMASTLEPTTVHLRMVQGDGSLEVLEQNYRYDLISSQKILDRMLNSEIVVALKGGEIVKGKYLGSSGESLVLQLPDGGIKMFNSAEMTSVTAPSLPQGLVTSPTLVWLLSSDITGERQAEVSYLASDIGWHAEYIGVLDDRDEKMLFNGWASINNASGKTYKDATIKLVAGDVNWTRPKPQPALSGFDKEYGTQSMRVVGMKSQIVTRPVFEYHLYELTRPSTLANNETKQLALFDPSSVSVVKSYRYDIQPKNPHVNVEVAFKNSKDNGLGTAIPAGMVRLSKLDVDGSLEFLGENRISHTAVDEEVRLKVGSAFDIVGETTVLESKREKKGGLDEKIMAKLRNHKSQSAVVLATFFRGVPAEVSDVEGVTEYRKVDANTIEFTVPVAAGGETVFQFRVAYGR
jgi:hypothetical protein